MEILFEELRCEPFYEPGPEQPPRRSGTLQSPSPHSVVTSSSTPPALTPATQQRFSSTTDSLLKRKIGSTDESVDRQPSNSAKLPRLTMEAVGKKSSKGNVMAGQQQQQQQQQQQPRPRGRPLGSKNKPTSKFKSISPAGSKLIVPKAAQASNIMKSNSNSNVPPTSPNKRLPIYHNAHKMYHSQLKQQQQQQQHPQTVPSGAAITTTSMATVIRPDLQVNSTPPPTLITMNLTTTTPVIVGRPQQQVASNVVPVQQQQQSQDAEGSSGRNDVNSEYHLSKLPKDPNEWNIDQVRFC